MKKVIVLVLTVVLIAAALTACGGKNDSDKDGAGGSGEKIKIVTTIFPVYDWVKNIADKDGLKADISMLADSGVDLHSFEPTTEDIEKISESDMFFYVGGESDEWVADVLNSIEDKGVTAVNLMDLLGDNAVEEKEIEGMQEEEHEHGHEEGEEKEYDEHVWLSLKNAAFLCEKMAVTIGKKYKTDADKYKENAEEYIKKLTKLDGQYRKAVSKATRKTVLFGDRFPFRYLMDDYGLDYYAAFSGCSAESEASFKTITFLAGKVDELGLGSIMTIEKNDHKIAESIIKNTKTKDQKILTMDSMQSTTSADVEKGEEYLKVMENNLEVLKDALK